MPEQDFWAERWTKGEIAFHEGRVSEHLERFVGELGKPGRVFVPLCGRAYDLLWLRQRGFNVVGAEFVESAARQFFVEHGIESYEIEVGDIPAISGGGITIVIGDVFKIEAEEIGRFDAIYDRAALVALDPTRRAEYVQLLNTLREPGAPWLLITVEHDRAGGPPFSVPPATVDELFAGANDVTQLADTGECPPPPAGSPPALRSRAWRITARAR
jgi:thiopurine S-methyltransferase